MQPPAGGIDRVSDGYLGRGLVSHPQAVAFFQKRERGNDA